MTRITIEAEGNWHRLSAMGHADDIEACNYITGVLYSLAGFLSNEEAGGDAVVQQLHIEPGDVVIDAEGGERTEAAFEMACAGLLQLQATRPEAVQVKIEGQ